MGRFRSASSGVVAGLAVVAVLLAACDGQEAETPPEDAADEPVGEEPTTGPSREGWTAPNGDDANTRNATSTIERSNVDELRVAWTFTPTGQATFGSIASEPLIADGVVYLQDLGSNLVALDLDTGAVRWETTYDQPVAGPNGPALGADLLFAPVGSRGFVALDPDTGEEVWEVRLDTAAGQPKVDGDTVYAGTNTATYRGGTSGIAYALDAATGEERWRFQVVEEGFWGDEVINSGGGLWLPPSFDRDRGHVYWGTGNPAPFPGLVDHPNASSRPEPNLYANSLVALEAGSGELAWYDYVEPNDLFDHDFHGSPVLVDDVEVAGRRVDVVLGAGKNGKVGAWDRASGERLWLTEVGVHQNAELTELPLGEPVEVYPGYLGGVQTPMAVADGVVYAPVVNLPTTYEATAFGSRTSAEALAYLRSPPPTEGTGELVALEVATGEILWATELEQPTFAAATVVNDLVFTATFGGTILAFERATGAEVWRHQASAGINAWPAVHGDTIVWGAGAGPEPQLLALRLGADPTGPGVAPDPDPDDTPGERAGGDVVTLELATPEGSRYDRDTFVVAAGAEVTLVYDNASDIAHNVAFYRGSDASAPLLARTDIEPGPVTQRLTFTAPDEPGRYHFQCDPHPTLMFGTLVVE